MSEKLDILIISHYFPPLNSIASHRPYSWAKYWSEEGHNVTVLTTKKTKSGLDLKLDLSSIKILEYNTVYGRLSSLRPSDLSKNKSFSTKDIKKSYLKSILLKYINYINEKIFYKFGIVFYDARMPNLIATGQQNGYLQVRNNWDLIVSTYAPYSTHQIAYRLKEKGYAKTWIADYRDLWTLSHLYTGLFPFNLYEDFLERKINLSADYITTVSEPLAEQIRNKYRVDNVKVIENGFDLEDIKKIPIKKYWDDKKIRIIYTGSIYQGYQDPSPLFKAIENIHNSLDKDKLKNLEVLFAGGKKGDLDALIKKYNVKKYVRHIGMMSRESVLHMQRDSNVLLFLEYESKDIGGILTGKLFEYLASGTPIWVIGLDKNSSVGKIISSSNQGIIFGKNDKLVEQELLKILSSKYQKKQFVNLDIMKKYSRKNLALKILKLVK